MFLGFWGFFFEFLVFWGCLGVFRALGLLGFRAFVEDHVASHVCRA